MKLIGYIWGEFYGKREIAHGGSIESASAHLSHRLDNGVTIAVVSNTTGLGKASDLCDVIQENILSSRETLTRDISRMVPKGAAGMIAILQRGEKPEYIASGDTSVISKIRSINERTAFLIGSGAKMFTGLLTKIVEEKGTLSLNSKLSDFMREEEFAMFADPEAVKEITLEMLLSNTSGLQYWADDFNNTRAGHSQTQSFIDVNPAMSTFLQHLAIRSIRIAIK